MSKAARTPLVRRNCRPDLAYAVVEGYYELGYDPTLYVPVSIEPMEQ